MGRGNLGQRENLDALQRHRDLLRRGRRDGCWHDRRGGRGRGRGGRWRVVELLTAVNAGTADGELLPPKALVARGELLDLVERHILYHRAGCDGGGAGSLESRGPH
jgi:hypothetical protein